MTEQRQIDIMITGEPPTCPRCGEEGLLLVDVPYGWTNAGGTAADGRNGVVLCAGCDARVPHAAPLITWFHVHGVADDGDDEFVRLLVAWAQHVHGSALDMDALDAEAELWRHGLL
ncbi:DUF6300 family protein [Nonomuraea sp. M3C6]|uniref:DUF6300 family protein n=1 Tax=Nonomuraea marmarensis TaxID=3351344 RepID=A0ABW7AJ04_9ACTN